MTSSPSRLRLCAMLRATPPGVSRTVPGFESPDTKGWKVVAVMSAFAPPITQITIVKAKVGPQILSLVCDEKIFDSIPVKKEVKASVSGIYITEVKGLHGKTAQAEVKKKGKFKAFVERMQEKAGAKPIK